MIAVEHPIPPPGDATRSATIIARRYQAHPPGFVYVLLTILLVLGAVNSQNNLLFAIFGLAVAGIVVSGIVSGAAVLGLRVRREVIAPADAGKEVRILYHVRNVNWLIPAGGIVIEEVEVDRRGRYRSTWPAHTGPIAAHVPWVRAHEEVVVEGRGSALARGRPTLNLIRLSTTFPFGLTRKYALYSQPDHLLIWPWIATIKQDAITRAGGGVLGTRDRRVTRAADAEFFAIRDYVRGDNPRAIAWKSSARRGQLVVREHAELEHRRVGLEVTPGSLAGEDLERFLSAVAALASGKITQGVDVSFRCGGTTLPIGGGARHLRRILDALAVLPVPHPTDANAVGRGHLTLRSLENASTVAITSSELVAACEGWERFPLAPTPRGARRWNSLRWCQIFNAWRARTTGRGGNQ